MMKKVLAVMLNLQSSKHCCWPMASAQPSSPASGEERSPNFTRAFCAGTRSALPSASPRERRVSKAPRNPPAPPGDAPAPRLPRSRVGPRSPTSRRGQRRLRGRDAAGHGAAQQQEEPPHGSGGRTDGRTEAGAGKG